MSRFFLIIEDGPERGRRVTIPEHAPTLLGRGDDVGLRLPEDDKRVSRRHASVRVSEGQLVLTDVGSTHGTTVNGERVTERPLRDGDRLQVGRTVLRVEAPPPPARIVAAPTEIGDDVEMTIPSGAALATVFLQTTDAAQNAASHASWPCGGCGRPNPQSAAPAEGYGWLCDDCAESRRRGAKATPGLAFGGFECLRLLADGGMGRVYEARHVVSRAHAAVKELLPDAAATPSAVRRFLREQKIAFALRHPRVLTTFEVGSRPTDARLYIASEFVRGGDAAKIASPTLPLATAVSIAADLFEALAYAHARGFVHRDVKLENLLLDAPAPPHPPRAKLADLGLAKAWGETGGTQITEAEKLGSMLYVAPEQLIDFKHAGPSVDVYSGAAALYRLLTGQLHLPIEPHELTVPNLLARTLDGARVPIRARRPEVPADLAAWIDLLVARDPSQRAHVSAASVAEVLARGIGRA